ncbi:hypothetical protein J7E62_09285 [Variovorax paradoxus]|nr:hypothetical protein [Variovorax paradoxus]
MTTTTEPTLSEHIVNVWMGVYGDYPIPERFDAVRVTAKGWPDRRSRELYLSFMDWVREQEMKALGAIKKAEARLRGLP